MLKRTITGLIIVLLIIPVCIFWHTWILPVFVAALSLLGVYEILGCIGMRRVWVVSIPAALLAAVAPIGARLFSSRLFISLYTLVMFTYLVLILSAAVFSRGSIDVEKIGMSYASVFYVITAFTAMILLCERRFGNYVLLMTIFGPWITDVFAYLTGRLFGRHKLIPEISPKKTVEGAIGGIVFCTLAAVLFGFVLSKTADDITAVGYLPLAIAGFLISILSQIGDLILSAVKRRYAIKDFGWILPGHGGILDRFDSVIGVVPVMLILFEFPEFFHFFM